MGTTGDIVLIAPGIKEMEGAQDWLARLGINLERVLKPYAGTGVQSLTPESSNSEEALEKAAVLVPVLNDAYPEEGKYSAFLRTALFRTGAGPRSLIVLKTSPVKAAEQPGISPDTPAVDMYEVTADAIKLLDDASEIYWSKLLDLAGEIKNALSARSEPTEMQNRTVYLAQASGDMVRNREILKRELVEQGYDVVPVADLSNHASELKSHIQKLVDSSILAIHLLGNEYGEIVNDTGLSMAEMQVLYAGEYLEALENDPVHASKSVSRLIWIDPEFSPRNQNQEDFINRLKKDLEHLHRTEIIQVPVEAFKTLVINKLKNWKKESGPAPAGDGKEGFLYLVHSPDDQNEVVKISEGLQKEGCTTRMLDYDGDQAMLLNDHKQCLKECTGAVVYYGSPNQSWLGSKVLDLLKAPGLGRTSPLQTRLVVAAKKDLLEGYSPPEGITLIRDTSLSGVTSRILETLKP